MRILLATDQTFDDKYFTQFSKYALREDIVVIEYSNVKTEIEDRLLTKQEHFDLIIFDVYQSIDFDLNDNILTYIRTRTELSVYSAKNFKLNNIPIVFIYKNYMDQRNGEISLSHFHYNIEYLTNENIPLYNTGMASAIDYWLSDLAGDLDRLDLNTNFIFDKTNSQLNNEKIYDCKVLTNEFLTRKSNLDYNWIGNKLNLIEAGAEELYTLVKRHQNNPKLRNEKAIHAALKTNSGYLLEEKYKYSLYERQLYYNSSRRYIEVDFINVNHSYHNVPIELYEVKLPNHTFTSKKGILYNSTRKYLDQIGKKYCEYFSNSTNYNQIKSKLNVDPMPFSLSLLIGRKEDLEENKYILNKAMADYSQFINVQSYDDLIEKYNFLYKRIKRFNIK